MIDGISSPLPRLNDADRGVASLGALASIGALFSAAACCILPLALGAVGIGAGGLAVLVPLHWPLTIAAVVAVAAGWVLYMRKRRACAADRACAVSPPTRTTFIMLCVATVIIGLSSLWSFIEQPLMRLLGGA